MKFAKAIVATIGAVVAVVSSAIEDSNLTGSEWGDIAIAFVTALTVYFIPNKG